jgi:hypothetical protein
MQLLDMCTCNGASGGESHPCYHSQISYSSLIWARKSYRYLIPVKKAFWVGVCTIIQVVQRAQAGRGG